jgi:phage shock protein A
MMKNDEDLARAALYRRQIHMSLSESLLKQIEFQSKSVDSLCSTIDFLETKVKDITQTRKINHFNNMETTINLDHIWNEMKIHDQMPQSTSFEALNKIKESCEYLTLNHAHNDSFFHKMSKTMEEKLLSLEHQSTIDHEINEIRSQINI